MSTNSDSAEAGTLAAARERLTLVRAKHRDLASRIPGLDSAVVALVRRLEPAKVTALLEGTTAARAQVEKLQAELDIAVEERDRAEEAARLLATEAGAVAAEVARLEAGPERARIEAAKAALRVRIAKRASEFTGFAQDVIALDRLESRIVHGFADDRVLEYVAEQAGTSAADLNTAGRAFGAAVLRGKEV